MLFQVLKFFFVLNFTLYFCSPLPAEQSPTQTLLLKARQLYENQDWSQAKELYFSIPSDHPHFSLALNEVQKINYLKKDWSSFFATALFIQKKWTQGKLTELHSEAASLYLLALGQFCYFTRAQIQHQWFKEAAPQNSALQKQIHLAMERVQLRKNYLFQNPKSKQKFAKYVVNKNQFWNLHSDLLTKISHPKNLRIKVKSLCGK